MFQRPRLAADVALSVRRFLAASEEYRPELTGYGRDLRIVEATSPKELFMNLTQPTGTLRVESDPPGARILINGELRAESTPTTFTLPAGK